MTPLEWAQARLANTGRIAATKTGADRAGWLEDAAYWKQIVDCLVLVQRIVTGDGQQLENLEMSEDEWNEGAGITEDGASVEITMQRDDWFDLIRAAGGMVKHD